MLQEKHGKLRGPSGAAALTTALPQFSEFKTRLVLAKKMTVRDVWSLMLHSVRGEQPDTALAGLLSVDLRTYFVLPKPRCEYRFAM